MICSSSTQKKYFKYYFELHDNYIFCKKSESEGEIAYMDVKNAFLRITKQTNINGVDHFGLKFIKKKTYEELYCPDEKTILKWFE